MHVEKAYFKNKEDGVQLLPLRFVPWKKAIELVIV